jgi:hypothetical protein
MARGRRDAGEADIRVRVDLLAADKSAGAIRVVIEP